MEKYHKVKKARIEQRTSIPQEWNSNVRRTADFTAATNSFIFKAPFGEGSTTVSALADQGVAANYISKTLVEEIHQQMSDAGSEWLQPMQNFQGATGDPCLTCHIMAKLDISLNIRRASKLILRNMEWKIAEE